MLMQSSVNVVAVATPCISLVLTKLMQDDAIIQSF